MQKQRYVVNAMVYIDLVVIAESHQQAADSLPCSALANSVRLESEPHESRLAVVDWCCFCGASILSNADGSWTGVGVPLEMIPEIQRNPFTDKETCCHSCATEKGLL